ncbi:hypothetical protein [Chitinophaga sp. MM2321]
MKKTIPILAVALLAGACQPTKEYRHTRNSYNKIASSFTYTKKLG